MITKWWEPFHCKEMYLEKINRVPYIYAYMDLQVPTCTRDIIVVTITTKNKKTWMKCWHRWIDWNKYYEFMRQRKLVSSRYGNTHCFQITTIRIVLMTSVERSGRGSSSFPLHCQRIPVDNGEPHGKQTYTELFLWQYTVHWLMMCIGLKMGQGGDDRRVEVREEVRGDGERKGRGGGGWEYMRTVMSCSCICDSMLCTDWWCTRMGQRRDGTVG